MQDIEPPEVRNRRRNHRLDGRQVGKIERNRQRDRTERVGQLAGSIMSEVGKHYLRPSHDEQACGRSADASSRARDDRHFSIECKAHVLRFRSSSGPNGRPFAGTYAAGENSGKTALFCSQNWRR
jgi:hypothetical protein